MSDVAAIAKEAFAAIDAGRQITPFSARPGGFTPQDACRVRPLLRQAFEARGERIVGRKIGFTNSRIWPEYGVDAPIWGYVTDRTLRDLATTSSLSLTGLPEPKIEPEIVLGLAAVPSPGMDDATLLGCVEWLALGYEVVQSIYPNWTFSAADTVAANTLHGALLIGQRHAIAQRRDDWLRELADFKIELLCNGRVLDRGEAANVLGGPLKVLGRVSDMLAQDPLNPPLAKGDIVSTGTLTRALDIKAGESWTARVSGIPLDPVVLQVS